MFNWANQTTAHPLGLALLALCVCAVFMLPRRYAIFPFVVMIMAIPSAQRIVVATIDFSFLRILVMVILLRCLIKGEYRFIKSHAADKWLLVWMVWGIFSYTILFGTVSALIARTGFMLDAVGSYYVGRMYFRSSEDIKRLILFTGILSVPVFFMFLVERATGRNVFAIFGGVPSITLIRDGRLRCQGPFSHPIMAGVFWAVVLPWLVAMWQAKAISKFLLIVFAVCILGIVINTASSTPVMSVIFGALGIFIFYFRKHLSLMRWSVFFGLILLHFVMKKPVWHLISRIDISGGSTGWHRYYLIDQSIKHFHEWWLFGVQGTAHWGRGLQDVTNQFILEGVRGGALGLIFFLLFIYVIFKLVGWAIRMSTNKLDIWVLWGCGVMLFVHIMNFFAVSYFGQMQNAFYLFLGGTVSVAMAIGMSGATERKRWSELRGRLRQEENGNAT